MKKLFTRQIPLQSPNSTAAVLVVLILIVLSLIPIIYPQAYLLHLLISVFLGITLAASFNIIAGLAGQLSLGHAAFFGFGAYLVAFAIKSGCPIIPAIIIGCLGAGLIAIPIGGVTLRLRGVYFAFATLGCAEVLRVLFLSFPQLGGASGFVLPTPEEYNKAFYYYIALAIAILSIITTWAIINSRFGYGLAAILNDEDAAKTTGINTMLFKLEAFVISAIFAGLAGGTYASYMLYIEPNMAYSAFISIEMQVMAIFGGLGTIVGPIIGGSLIKLLREITTYTLAGVIFPGFYLIVYGLILVLVIILAPRGVAGIMKRKRKR